MNDRTLESVDSVIETVANVIKGGEIPADTSTDKLISALAGLVSARAELERV